MRLHPFHVSAEFFVHPVLTPYSVVSYLHVKHVLEAVREAVPFLHGRLLDMGCGRKPYRSVLRCASHIGVDVSTSPNFNHAIDCIYDGAHLPFGDASFDSVLCTEVLEHCSEPWAFMKEVSRVLKPGGHALITVPFVIHHHEEPFDFTRFTRYGLIEVVTRSGMSPVWVRSRGAEYATAIALVYLAVSYTVSRRPIIDAVLWLLWPLAMATLALDGWRRKDPCISLGWQMLTRKAGTVLVQSADGGLTAPANAV
jgi:SAM-dependent methyltransferase